VEFLHILAEKEKEEKKAERKEKGMGNDERRRKRSEEKGRRAKRGRRRDRSGERGESKMRGEEDEEEVKFILYNLLYLGAPRVYTPREYSPHSAFPCLQVSPARRAPNLN